jgi:hypothetical protein
MVEAAGSHPSQAETQSQLSALEAVPRIAMAIDAHAGVLVLLA